jgi:hypothetical protein
VGKGIWDGDNDGNGEQFWEGDWNGNPVNGLYNNWGGEPDNWNIQNGLGLALTNWPYGVPGQWNDVDDSNDLYYIIEYENATGISEPGLNKDQVQIFPNPARDRINFLLSKSQILRQVSIYNEMGIIVFQEDFHQDSPGSIDVENWVPGIYFINMKFTNTKTVNRLIIIK